MSAQSIKEQIERLVTWRDTLENLKAGYVKDGIPADQLIRYDNQIETIDNIITGLRLRMVVA